MKRLLGILLVLIICVGISGESLAQATESPTAVTQPSGRWELLKQKASVKWNEWKTKAVTMWQKWNSKEERIPSSEVAKTAVEAPIQNNALPGQITSKEKEGVTVQAQPQTQEINKVLQKVKTSETHVVSKPGRKAAADIPKAKSGVPVFSLEQKSKAKNGKTVKIKVKSIPLLDIGEEEQLSRKEWTLDSPTLSELKIDSFKALDSPALTDSKSVLKLVQRPLDKAIENKKLEVIRLALPDGIDLQVVQNINYKVSSEVIVNELPVKIFTEDKLNLIKGLILAEYSKKCHIAVGLLNSIKEKLTDEENQIRDFYQNSCIHEIGFYTDSIPGLLEIAKKGVPQFSSQAIDILVKDLPREYVKDVGGALKSIPETQVSEKSKNNFNFYIALSESMKRKFDTALSYALKVKPDSNKYMEAQYLAAVAEYSQDKIKDSIARQEQILKDLPKYKSEAPIESLVKMNLGRTAYRNKDYKKALENYQFISKDNPLWIQALTEQGWMQLLSKDAFGAIGNMYSLHSPFFNSIYKPESYVVRTIGYLNICQYGDAYKTLTHFENSYRSFLDKIDSFQKQAVTDVDYYNYVLTHLKSKSKETDGRLPMTVVKEIARQRDFINFQQAINNAIDQDVQYGFIKNLVKSDANAIIGRINQVKKRINELTVKIDGAKKNSESAKFVNEWKQSREFERDTLPYLQYEKQTYAKSFEEFKNYEKQSKPGLAKWNNKLKSAAGGALKSHLNTAEKKLAQYIENNEFLRYEVYAGSGENIRFISAGGSTERRMAAADEPKDAKQKWNFDGEFWADEIGHYRSTLKDNCPQNVSASVK